MPDWLAATIGGVILFSSVSFFFWFRARNAHRKLQAERALYSDEQIASDFSLWDKFYNWYVEVGKETTVSDFESFSLETKLEMLSQQTKEIKNRT